MSEKVTLSTPVPGKDPGLSSLEPVFIGLFWEEKRIELHVRGENKKLIKVQWANSAGEDAVLMMRQLNKANLTTKSLLRRAMERALLDGKLPSGTITGTPD